MLLQHAMALLLHALDSNVDPPDRAFQEPMVLLSPLPRPKIVLTLHAVQRQKQPVHPGSETRDELQARHDTLQ